MKPVWRDSKVKGMVEFRLRETCGAYIYKTERGYDYQICCGNFSTGWRYAGKTLATAKRNVSRVLSRSRRAVEELDIAMWKTL